MRFFPFSAVVLSSCLIQVATAADGQALLKRLNNAERHQSFQGTFVYDSNGVFSTHNIWSLVDSGASRQRLLQIDGAEQEVLSVNGHVECASDGLSDLPVKGHLWMTRNLDAKQLEQWYELVVLGESRVAGRPTSVLALVPRDAYRYGIKLHLDRQTGLPLKSLLIGDKGQLLERFQFTRLTLEAPASRALKPTASCRPVHNDEMAEGDAHKWSSEWLPPGFRLGAVKTRRSPVSNEPVACQVYGDGVASFSVFVEPLKGEKAKDLVTQFGSTVAVSHRLKTGDGDVMVTVVGEIPLAAAQRVAHSMQLPQE